MTETKIQRISPKEFIKIVMATKSVTINDLSSKTGKTASNIGMILNNNKPTFKTFGEIMKALDEELLVTLKNGNQFIIELNK
jgi:hypothetical protein